jgi:hypothetical protein
LVAGKNYITSSGSRAAERSRASSGDGWTAIVIELIDRFMDAKDSPCLSIHFVTCQPNELNKSPHNIVNLITVCHIFLVGSEL